MKTVQNAINNVASIKPFKQGLHEQTNKSALR